MNDVLIDKSIEEVLGLDDRKSRIVKVPEWGASIRVDSMSAEERSELEKRWAKKDATKNPSAFRADVLTQCVKKHDGEPWGTEEQFKALMHKNGAAVERLFEAGCELSGMSEADVEKLEKN